MTMPSYYALLLEGGAAGPAGARVWTPKISKSLWDFQICLSRGLLDATPQAKRDGKNTVGEVSGQAISKVDSDNREAQLVENLRL